MRTQNEFHVVVYFGDDILTEKTMVITLDGSRVMGGRIGDVMLSAEQAAGIIDAAIASKEAPAA